MKHLSWILPLSFAVSCPAQNLCNPNALSQAAARVLILQNELGQTKVDEMDVSVPPTVAVKITQLKDALSHASDAALACAEPSENPIELQKRLAQMLHANAPEPPANTAISKDDHRYDEILGSYGHNLRVQVSRPPAVAGVLLIQYFTNIECGADSMLLAYELRDGTWMQKLRWQSPPLKMISDAFGDFFVSAALPDSSALENTNSKWRLVVAHGTPWCTSRFSNFKIDLLSPGPDPASPQVLWHTEREYSRDEFEPRIKSSANTFELRLNADCMSFDPANCFERRVIYRYSVDGNDHVHRVGPLANNARASWQNGSSHLGSNRKIFLLLSLQLLCKKSTTNSLRRSNQTMISTPVMVMDQFEHVRLREHFRFRSIQLWKKSYQASPTENQNLLPLIIFMCVK